MKNNFFKAWDCCFYFVSIIWLIERKGKCAWLYEKNFFFSIQLKLGTSNIWQYATPIHTTQISTHVGLCGLGYILHIAHKYAVFFLLSTSSEGNVLFVENETLEYGLITYDLKALAMCWIRIWIDLERFDSSFAN